MFFIISFLAINTLNYFSTYLCIIDIMAVYFILSISIFIFLLFSLSFCKDTIMTLPFQMKINYRNDYVVFMELTNPKTHTTINPFVFLVGFITYIPDGSTPILRDDFMIHRDMNRTYQLYQSNIKISDYEFPFYFYGSYSKGDDYGYSGIDTQLNFAFKPQIETTSFVYQLYYSHIIDRMIFGINYKKDFREGGNIYIGGIPIQYTENKRYGECDVIDGNWMCKVNEVYFGDVHFKEYVYNKTSKVVFRLYHEGIVVPHDYFIYLKEKVFHNQYYSVGLRNRKFIYCRINTEQDRTFFATYPKNINFVFDKFILHIPILKMLYKGEAFQIEDGETENQFFFGNQFLQYFTTVFNYEKEKVQFYIKEGNEDIEFIPIVNTIKEISNILLLKTIGLSIGLMMIVFKMKNVSIEYSQK